MKLQVILREQELNEAIRAYVAAAGYPVEGMDVDINLIKGRSGFGSTRAEVDFLPAGELVRDETISDKIEDIVDDIEEVVEDTVDAVEDTIEEVIEDVTDFVEDTIDDVKEAVTDLFGGKKESKEGVAVERSSLFS